MFSDVKMALQRVRSTIFVLFFSETTDFYELRICFYHLRMIRS